MLVSKYTANDTSLVLSVYPVHHRAAATVRTPTIPPSMWPGTGHKSWYDPAFMGTNIHVSDAPGSRATCEGVVLLKPA
jgi:hypothetical protein